MYVCSRLWISTKVGDRNEDHRGIKQPYGAMKSFVSFKSAGLFCKAHGELRNYYKTNQRGEKRSLRDLISYLRLITPLKRLLDYFDNPLVTVQVVLSGSGVTANDE